MALYKCTFIITFRKFHSFHDGHIMYFCYIYPPHLSGRSLKLLSAIKLVRGAEKVRDRWSNYVTSEEEGSWRECK